MSSNQKYPSSKEIISLLGIGVILGAMILFPGLGYVAKTVIDANDKHNKGEYEKYWKKFNGKLLKRNLNRLHQQKIIEIISQDGQEIIKLSQKGQTKYLKFKLEGLSAKGKGWDGKWRMVLYDIGKLKKIQQEQLRRTFKQMNFLMFQKSAYLTPYSCNEEVEYLRQYFGVSEEVSIIEISSLENEQYFKQYFGL